MILHPWESRSPPSLKDPIQRLGPFFLHETQLRYHGYVVARPSHLELDLGTENVPCRLDTKSNFFQTRSIYLGRVFFFNELGFSSFLSIAGLLLPSLWPKPQGVSGNRRPPSLSSGKPIFMPCRYLHLFSFR